MPMIRAKAALKRQTLMAGGMVLLFASYLYAQTITPVGTISTSWLDRLLEPQNIIAVGLVLFHLGGLRSQFADMRKRLSDLEHWKNLEVDKIYARKETVSAQLHRRTADRKWNADTQE